jgi:parallel beta-helix repeat protein
MRNKKSAKIFNLLFFAASAACFLLITEKAQALDCGVCGSTITSSCTLAGDLNCVGSAWTIGAAGITIDGGGHTLTGNGTDNGIANYAGWDNITITNFAGINNYALGILFINSTGNTISYNTFDSNGSVNISLSASSATITHNTINSSFLGISLPADCPGGNDISYNDFYLNSIALQLAASSNTLDHNTFTANSRGIQITGTASGNVLTNNAFSVNSYNIQISVPGALTNTIDTTNTIEGKKVYYLTNVSDTIYDGDDTDIGMFWCINCNNITLRDATLSTHNFYSVYFYNTTNSTIDYVTASAGYIGIYLQSSSGNTLTNNTTDENIAYGIYLDSSDDNTLTSNTADSNISYGFVLASSDDNEINDNTLAHNRNDISDNGSNNWHDNQFLNNIGTEMVSLTDVERSIVLNATVNYTLTMKNPNGSDGNDCAYSVTVSPTESTTPVKTDNVLTGSFIATKKGFYSLDVQITDTNDNVTERKYPFFVAATGSLKTRYYLRDVDPTHGQPTGSDSNALLFTLPTTEEEWRCNNWVQSSPDVLPNFPLANISGIDIYSWYSTTAAGYIGAQRFLAYGESVDANAKQNILLSLDYTWTTDGIIFTGLDWDMEYAWYWYWIALKLDGANPHWRTLPPAQGNTSYADFTYSYTTTPAIKSSSNTDIVIVSATEPATDPGNATVVLDGTGTTNFVLDDFNRPFLSSISLISSDGTTTVTPSNIDGVTTLTSIPLEITPSSGTIEVQIDTWNTSGTYYKKWTETGSASNITSSHTIGNLRSNVYYTVTADDSSTGITGTNCSNGSCLSDANGQITFTYNGGYSSKTFEVQDTTAPTNNGISSITADSTSQLTITANAATDSESGLHATPYYFDRNNGAANSGWQASTIWIDTGLSANTQYSYKVKAKDIAGNESEYSSIVSKYTLTPSSSGGGGGGGYYMPESEDALIKRLLAQIEELKRQIAILQQILRDRNIAGSYKPITINLKYKDRKPEVISLQYCLSKDKSIYPEGKITGYFGPLTLEAVKRFQERYRDETLSPLNLKQGTGYVGEYTRKVLDKLCQKE